MQMRLRNRSRDPILDADWLIYRSRGRGGIKGIKTKCWPLIGCRSDGHFPILFLPFKPIHTILLSCPGSGCHGQSPPFCVQSQREHYNILGFNNIDMDAF